MGQSRACTIVASWIMRKYQWNLLKTLEFLNSRRSDLEIRANFIHQLKDYELRLTTQGIGPKTTKWTEVWDKTNEFENEELLVRNTYLNAQMGPFADFSNLNGKSRPCKLKWADDQKSNAPLSTFIEEQLDNCTTNAIPEEKTNENKEATVPIIQTLNTNQITNEIIPVKTDIVCNKVNDIPHSMSNDNVAIMDAKQENQDKINIHNEIKNIKISKEPHQENNCEFYQMQNNKTELHDQSPYKNKKNENFMPDDVALHEKAPSKTIKSSISENMNSKEINSHQSLDPSNNIDRKYQEDIGKSAPGKILATMINNLVKPEQKLTRKHTAIKQRPSDNTSKVSRSVNQSTNLSNSHIPKKDISPLPLKTYKNLQRSDATKKIPSKKSTSSRPSSAIVKRNSSIAKT